MGIVGLSNLDRGVLDSFLRLLMVVDIGSEKEVMAIHNMAFTFREK